MKQKLENRQQVPIKASKSDLNRYEDLRLVSTPSELETELLEDSIENKHSSLRRKKSIDYQNISFGIESELENLNKLVSSLVFKEFILAGKM